MCNVTSNIKIDDMGVANEGDIELPVADMIAKIPEMTAPTRRFKINSSENGFGGVEFTFSFGLTSSALSVIPASVSPADNFRTPITDPAVVSSVK